MRSSLLPFFFFSCKLQSYFSTISLVQLKLDGPPFGAKKIYHRESKHILKLEILTRDTINNNKNNNNRQTTRKVHFEKGNAGRIQARMLNINIWPSKGVESKTFPIRITIIFNRKFLDHESIHVNKLPVNAPKIYSPSISILCTVCSTLSIPHPLVQSLSPGALLKERPNIEGECWIFMGRERVIKKIFLPSVSKVHQGIIPRTKWTTRHEHLIYVNKL